MEEFIQVGKRKIKRQANESQNQSVSSLEQRSSRSCQQSSLPEKYHRSSLVQVKSNDEDSHGDIYEYYLIEQGKKIKLRSSVSSRQGSAASQNQMEAEIPFRKKMSDTGKLLSHECQCDDDNCLAFHCSCYNQPNQMCLANSCCPNCIEMKIKLLQTTQQKVSDQIHVKTNHKTPPSQCTCQHISQKTGHKSVASGGIPKWKLTIHGTHSRNTMFKASHSFKNSKGFNTISCSCKKSHCLKKYCICYTLGKKCLPNCQCQECQNHNQPGNQQENARNGETLINNILHSQEKVIFDIDQVWEQKNYDLQIMPESMQFQFPDLKNAYHI